MKFVTLLNIKPHLIGHSFGGAISIRSKSLHPEFFRRTVLMAPAGLERTKVESLQTLTAVLQNELPVLFFLKSGQERRDILIDIMQHKTDLVKFVQILLNLDLINDMKTLKGEIILIWGSQDNVLPVNLLNDFKKIIRRKKVYVLNGGHHIYDDHPQKVAQIIHKELS